jgi:hypothetical protein
MPNHGISRQITTCHGLFENLKDCLFFMATPNQPKSTHRPGLATAGLLSLYLNEYIEAFRVGDGGGLAGLTRNS